MRNYKKKELTQEPKKPSQNKTLSDNPDPGLALQGIGWFIRKGIGMASVTLHVKMYEGPPNPPSTSTDPVMHIDIVQTATGGVKGTTEIRCADGVAREHTDWLFGTVRGRTTWISAADIDDEHLRGNWLEGDEEKAGPNGETHIKSLAESVDNGWTATQIWGFQMINGERRYARNVVIAKGKDRVEFRLVYDYLGEDTDE